MSVHVDTPTPPIYALSDRITKKSGYLDTPLIYALLKKTGNYFSKLKIVCQDSGKYEVRNCECPYNSNNIYTNVVVQNIPEQEGRTICNYIHASKYIKLNGTGLKPAHTLNGIGEVMKPESCVAFNFYGKCGKCNLSVKEVNFLKLILLGNKQATSDIKDSFKALIKGENICIDKLLNIITLDKRTITPNIMSDHYTQKYIENGEDETDENVYTADTRRSVSTDETSVKRKEKDFSTIHPNMNLEGIENISTSNVFPADNDKDNEMIRNIVLTNGMQYVTPSENESESTTYAISKSQFEPMTLFKNNAFLDLNVCSNNNACIKMSNESFDNSLLNSPRNGSQSYCEDGNQTDFKYVVDNENDMSEQSINETESLIHKDMRTDSIYTIDNKLYLFDSGDNTSISNSTEKDRLIPEEQDSVYTLRNFSIDEEKYILGSDCTNFSSTRNEKDQLQPAEQDIGLFDKLPNSPNMEERYSISSGYNISITSNNENDCLLPKEQVVGSSNDLSNSPIIEDRHLMTNECNTSYTSIDMLPHQIQRSRASSIDSNGDHCRVCHCGGDEVLISPCLCNGSLKYVHETCLITWMKNPFKDACEICKKKILIVKKRKPIYTWRWPIQRPTPLVWVIVFTTAICVNLMSVVKDATRKCVSTSCIIFYVIGSVGIILASMFLYFWVKRVKVFCESWKVQNEHWVVKIEEEVGKIV